MGASSFALFVWPCLIMFTLSPFRSQDLRTASGIGNYAGAAYIKKLHSAEDGWNTFGDVDHKANRQPYTDYTNYTPVNDAYTIKNPLKWQPLMESNGLGYITIQTHITPQAGLTQPFGLNRTDVAARKLPNPYPTGFNKTSYKAHVDDVLQTSAQLTDLQKMAAEYFDDQLMSIGIAGFILANRYKWNIHQHVAAESAGACLYDATIIAWKEKIAHSAVRPITAVRYLYGSKGLEPKRIKAYAGVGQGTQDIDADEWLPYLRTMPHADYPSGGVAVQSIKHYHQTTMLMDAMKCLGLDKQAC